MPSIRPHIIFTCLLSAGTLTFGQTPTVTNASGANSRLVVSPDSIVSAWGTGLSTQTVAASITGMGPATLPNTLGGLQLSLKDSANATFQPALYMVSPTQINYVLPANIALGTATLSISTSSGLTGPVYISNVAPAIFTVNGTTATIPAAQLVRYNSGAITAVDLVYQVSSGDVTARQLNISGSSGDSYYLMVYGTGVRRHSGNPVIATIGGTSVPVTYAGPQNQFPGFDQINIGPLPVSLAGKGALDLVIRVDGVPANTVKLTF